MAYGSRFDAQAAGDNIVKPYVVTRLEGTQKKTRWVYEEVSRRVTANGNTKPIYRRKEETIDEPAGFIVTFPVFGHSIRVPDKTTTINGREMHMLEAMGFDKDPGLINKATGDVVMEKKDQDEMHQSMQLSNILSPDYNAPSKKERASNTKDKG